MAGRAEHIGDTADARQLVRLLCAVATDGDGVAEEWLHILPGGPVVVARDDRIFQVLDAAAIIARSELPMLIDWEHNSERWDADTRAAGWLTELKSEAGGERSAGLWGKVKWTAKGKTDVESGEYRYLSPVLLIDGETRAVTQVVSVALTNKPALRLEQVGKFRERLSAQFGPLKAGREETSTMDEKTRKALCAALALAESASDSDILAATSKLGATRELLSTTNSQLTSANAQVETFRSRISELETQLAASQADAAKASRESEINALFEANKSKITPAMATSFRAMFAKTPATFEAFKEFTLPTLPEIGARAPESKPGPTTPDGSTKPLVSDKERAAFRKRGMTDAEIDAAAKALADNKARLTADDEED